MARFRVPLLCALTCAFAVVPAAALAAPPTVEHSRDVGTDVDPNFCGTGQEIDISFNVRVNDWISADELEERVTLSGKVVFTNPETGDSITLSFAGQTTSKAIEGEGQVTFLFTTKGLPEKLQTTHGPILTRDAGLIAFVDTFDENGELISSEVVIKGPHPELESDGELFCELATEALGIT